MRGMKNHGVVFRQFLFVQLIFLVLLIAFAYAGAHTDASGNRIVRDLICPAGGDVSSNDAGTTLRSSIGQPAAGKSETSAGYVLYHGAQGPSLPSETSAEFYDYP